MAIYQSRSFGIALVGSNLAGALASIELPVAVISASIFLGKTITSTQAIGVGLVFAGIILFNLPEKALFLKPKFIPR